MRFIDSRVAFGVVCAIALTFAPALLAEPLPGMPETSSGEIIQTAPTAASDFPVITPEILNEFRIMKYPRVGGRIAFSATVNGWERIFLLDLSQHKLSALIDGPSNNSFPSWSPDGTKLSFTSDRDGNKEIYIADWNGANQVRVTFNPTLDDNSSWSPDGAKLIFASEDVSGSQHIYSINPDGGDKTRMTRFEGKNALPRWSPDGRLIAYSTNRFWPGWDVCVYNLDLNSEICPLQGRENFCRADWSHTGNFLVYSTGTTEEINLATLNYSKQERTPLTTMPGREYDAVWSPNDQFIAFVAEEATARNVFNLFMTEALSDKVSEVIKSSYSMRYLSWSGATTEELTQRFAPAPTASASATPEPTLDTIDMLPDEYVPGYLQNKKGKEKH